MRRYQILTCKEEKVLNLQVVDIRVIKNEITIYQKLEAMLNHQIKKKDQII